MIPYFLVPDSLRRQMIAQQKAAHARRMTECVDWDPKMPWKKELNLKASSYSCLNLFPEVKPRGQPPNPNIVQEGHYAESPSGEWRYTLNTLPAGGMLNTWCGSKIGTVLFDGPVQIPALYRKEKHQDSSRYEENPWMSLTPAEIMSMRTGLRFAKGHTIVAGLGLGHLLIEVSKKKSVKKVTLIEISQELVDWIFPRVRPHLGMDVVVCVGDANSVIPSLEANVALIDIDSSYGNNVFHAPHQHVDKVWVWGSAKYRGEDDYW